MARISFYHVEVVKEESHNYNISRDMSSPKNVAIFLTNVLRINKSPVENFGVLVLDVHNNLIASHILTKGTLNATMAKAREVFQVALLHNGCSVILFHNHPSGDAAPSKNDIEVTDEIEKAGEILEIPVLDHVVIGDTYYSFANNGLL